MLKPISALLAASVLAGCAYNSAPVVGPHDKTDLEYQQDYVECQQYAAKVDKSEAMKAGAVNAGVLGALSGAAVGLIDGGVAEGAVVGGVAGASAGAAGGAAKATQDQAYVLRRCLAGKGYDVLDLRP
ncbi:MAG: hypothetical protein ACR2PT_22955 [Endozoicomonas sp.]